MRLFIVARKDQIEWNGPEVTRHFLLLAKRTAAKCRYFLKRDREAAFAVFDSTEAKIHLSSCYFSPSQKAGSQRERIVMRNKERGREEKRKREEGKERKMEERGGEQMEVGESRNKRYVNPRNGAVYSSHKKANKTFFRSGRYTPGPSSLPTPRFRSPPHGSPSYPRKNDRE